MGPVIRALKRGSPTTDSLQQAFEREGLGHRHGSALVAVALGAPLSVSELAERIGLSVATTSLMVGELSRAGLVDRAEDERDRRRTIVRLHPDYVEPAKAMVRERLGPLRRTLERLSPRARAQFLEGWRILDEETRRVAGGPEPGDCA